MRVGVPRSLLIAAAPSLVIALAAPSGAIAAETVRVLPVKGSSPGVVLREGGGSVALKSRLVQRSPRGRSLQVTCTEVPRADANGSTSSSVGTAVSARVRSIRLPSFGDWCVVTLTELRSRERSTRPIAVLARNAAGLDAVYERLAAPVMASVADIALGGFEGGPFDAPRIAALLDGSRIMGRRTRATVVSAPNTPVSTDQLGIFVEGQRVSVTGRTPGGRSLYVTYDGADRAISTNVLDALQDESFGTSVRGG